MSRKLCVAAIQMCSGPDIGRNLEQAAHLLSRAASSGVDWAVLPENFAALDADPGVVMQEAKAIRDWLVAQARDLGMGIVGGSMAWPERPDGSLPDGGRARATCWIVNHDGRIAGRYDKIHLFDAQVNDQRGGYRESAIYEAGTVPARVDLGEWSVQPVICYDLRFPELFRVWGAPVDWIAAPSAFTAVTGARHWEILCRARAIENQCYVVAANQGGLHPGGRETWGHSMIVSPDGEVLAEQRDATAEGGVMIAEIDREFLASLRRSIPVWAHRRLPCQSPE
ncbi:carbon-nitrogen hydrolase family protein [Hahella sp. SMD15-11]|uniref:Carbon-nitrogen hydrolase family protein n=1 Tax=Thermohahella caldifontis TaxID=3142973 RepID=A0AB39UZ98_9GAMM